MLLLLKYLPTLKTVRMRAYVPLTTQQAWKLPWAKPQGVQHPWLSRCDMWKNSWLVSYKLDTKWNMQNTQCNGKTMQNDTIIQGWQSQPGWECWHQHRWRGSARTIKGLRPLAPRQRSKLWISHGYTLTKIGRESCLAHWILTQYWHSIYDTVFTTRHLRSIDTVLTLCKHFTLGVRY